MLYAEWPEVVQAYPPTPEARNRRMHSEPMVSSPVNECTDVYKRRASNMRGNTLLGYCNVGPSCEGSATASEPIAVGECSSGGVIGA
jgi:hypothetical protein